MDDGDVTNRATSDASSACVKWLEWLGWARGEVCVASTRIDDALWSPNILDQLSLYHAGSSMPWYAISICMYTQCAAFTALHGGVLIDCSGQVGILGGVGYLNGV